MQNDLRSGGGGGRRMAEKRAEAEVFKNTLRINLRLRF